MSIGAVIGICAGIVTILAGIGGFTFYLVSIGRKAGIMESNIVELQRGHEEIHVTVNRHEKDISVLKIEYSSVKELLIEMFNSQTKNFDEFKADIKEDLKSIKSDIKHINKG